jgi:hypothetical protein
MRHAVRLKTTVVITQEDDWDPTDYETFDPAEAARIDQENISEDPRHYIDWQNAQVTVKVEPVYENNPNQMDLYRRQVCGKTMGQGEACNLPRDHDSEHALLAQDDPRAVPIPGWT